LDRGLRLRNFFGRGGIFFVSVLFDMLEAGLAFKRLLLDLSKEVSTALFRGVSTAWVAVLLLRFSELGREEFSCRC
jgi:hypothetical protein